MIVDFPKMRREEIRLAWHRDFGHQLRAARLARGITEVDAATAFRITLRTYRKREGGRPFHGGLLGMHSFTKKYDVSLSWLLGAGGSQFDRYVGERPARPALVLVSDNTA